MVYIDNFKIYPNTQTHLHNINLENLIPRWNKDRVDVLYVQEPNIKNNI